MLVRSMRPQENTVFVGVVDGTLTSLSDACNYASGG